MTAKMPLTDKAKRLKVLLLEPLVPIQAAWGVLRSLRGFIPPMGILSVYGWLKHRGYNVDFLDTQFGDYTADSLKTFLRQKGYDVVGMSVYTPTADYAFQTARWVKEALPACKVIMGNIHVSMLPELSMRQCPELDFIVRDEGEYATDEFLSELAEGKGEWSRINGLVYRDAARIRINPPRPFIENLDDLPVGFYADIDLRRYVPHETQYMALPSYPIMTQRGCPFSCTYCGAAKLLGKKTRFLSPDRVVEELKILQYGKKAKGVYFQDSTFTINRDFTVDLMQRMIKADLGLLWSCNTRADLVDPELLKLMYRAGGRQMAIGVESANQESLDLIKKNTTVEKQTRGVRWIREAGFRLLNNFIICLPGENDAMVRKTVDYAKTLRAPVSVFWLPVPYPGTELSEACKADGGLRLTDSWNDYLAYNFENPVYVNPKIGLEKMRFWQKKATFEYHLSPVILWENLRMLRTRDDLRKLLRSARTFTVMILSAAWSSLKRLLLALFGRS